MIEAIIKTINTEVFSVVISGVLIFTFQKLVSQLWISPIVDFKKCLAKIETLLNRYAFLCSYEYGGNDATDSEVEYFRKELRDIISEMLGTYYVLPCLYRKIWLGRIDIHKAKSEMFIVSGLISTYRDVRKEKIQAEISIEKISKYLNFSQVKYKYEDIHGQRYYFEFIPFCHFEMERSEV